MPRHAGKKPHPLAVAIVVSRYNSRITSRLLDGAARALRSAGRRYPATVFDAPGAFELPVLVHAAAASGRFAGVLALGCLVRGQTMHDRVIADAVANGLTRAAMDTGIPIAFGVLTVNTTAQALARAGGRKGNKGEEAMSALLDTIATVRDIRSGRSPARRTLTRPDKTRRRQP